MGSALPRNERGARSALAERSRHDLVAPDVELLDLIAREIGAARVAQLVPQRGVRQLLGDDGRDAADAADDQRQTARLIRGERGLLAGKVLVERHP
jgi:hypothetical protein